MTEIEEIKAAIAAAEREMGEFGRPVPSLSEICKPRGLREHQGRLEAWRQTNPELEARFKALCVSAENDAKRLEAVEFKEAEVRRGLMRLEQLGVGDRTLAAVRSPLQTPAMDAVRAWLPTSSWSLLLIGGPGCGKTVAAAWAAPHIFAAGGYVCWVRVAQAAHEGLYGAEADIRHRRWRNTTLLVLDDVGAEFKSDAWMGVLQEILDERWAHGRKTIVTSNLSLDAGDRSLRDRIGGARVMDRIAQDGQAVLCGSISLRRKPVTT